MAFVRHGNSFHINIPKQENKIITFRGNAKEIFNNVDTKNTKLKELIKLLQNHLIMNEYWSEGYKWIEKNSIKSIQYRLAFGDIPKEKGNFILILYKID